MVQKDGSGREVEREDRFRELNHERSNHPHHHLQSLILRLFSESLFNLRTRQDFQSTKQKETVRESLYDFQVQILSPRNKKEEKKKLLGLSLSLGTEIKIHHFYFFHSLFTFNLTFFT